MIRSTVLAIFLVVYRILAGEIPHSAPRVSSPHQRNLGSSNSGRPLFFGRERKNPIERKGESYHVIATGKLSAPLPTLRPQDQTGNAASNVLSYAKDLEGGSPRLSIIQHTNERQTFLSGHVHNRSDISPKRTESTLFASLTAKLRALVHRRPSSSYQKRRNYMGEAPDSRGPNIHRTWKRSLDSYSDALPKGSTEEPDVLTQHTHAKHLMEPSQSNIAPFDDRSDTDAKLTKSSESTYTQPLSLSQLSSFSSNEQKAFTLPLYRPKKFDYDNDVHPEIRFQQHLNHALQRHANFLNTSIDDAELVHNIRKRMESLSLPFSESSLRRRAGPVPVAQNNPNGYPVSSFRALNNSTITTPSNPTAKNSIGLSIQANDVGYLAEISIGTPPRKFKVILDSGSADTWVMLPQCRSSQNSAEGCNHPSLNAASSTLHMTNTNFKVSYGTGSVQGVLIKEDITIGGLLLRQHTFGGVTSASKEFTSSNIPFDGLMGTAKSSLSSQKVMTPIEAMAKAGLISGAFIGYSLGRVSDNQNIGQATFGGVDQTKFTGNLTMFRNVNTKGFWEGEMATILVNGQVVLKQKTGILDTGTTLIIAPPADAQALHARIPGASSDGKGGYLIPCTNKAKVALSFGGVPFEINPVDLTFQPTTTDLSANCISAISSGTVGGPNQWLLGDTFLKNVYFATDATHNEMGMAALKKVSSKG